MKQKLFMYTTKSKNPMIHKTVGQRQKMLAAIRGDCKVLSLNVEQQTALIEPSGGGDPYFVTLSSCTCKNAPTPNHWFPCKHIYTLDYYLALFKEDEET